MPEDSRGRRSAQSAMYRIAEAFVRWVAPILSFTAEEMWGYLPGKRLGHVLFSTWYDGLAPLGTEAALSAADFDQLLALREQVAKVLEPMRASGAIGAALDAEIAITADAATAARLSPLAEELRFLLISGDVTVVQGPVEGLSVLAEPTTKAKCVRCWQRRGDVGANAEHPELCGRCVSNISGVGEDRTWF
jgi:isoleucyl-tRNA synthetase